MRKYSYLLILTVYFFSSEIIAQNLNLTIIGSSTEETQIINSLNYKKEHLDINSILNEADSLQFKINKIGYLSSDFLPIDKKNDSTFQIQFNLNKNYENILIEYDTNYIDIKSLSKISKNIAAKNFSIPVLKIEESLKFINNKIANNGFPFAKTKLSQIEINDKNKLTAKLIINNTEEVRKISAIKLKGYEKFPKVFLKRFIKIKANQTFNLENIKNKVKALDNLRFAKQTKQPEILFTKDSTSLYMYLEKTKSNTFDGFLGFSTDEITNKINFNGYLNLELLNNLNFGESFNLSYKSDESEQKNFNINLRLPYILASPIGSELSLKIFRKDSTFTTITQKANVFYQFNSKNKIHLGFENESSNSLSEQTPEQTLLNYTSNLYSLKYNYENRQRQSLLFKKNRGVHFSYSFGYRTTIAIKERQDKLLLSAFNIFNLNKNNSIYTRFNGAILNSDTFIENELFRFGGINSIRGFEENSITGNSYFIFNTEYRYQLSKNIYVHSILDFANFENKLSKINENLFGLGIGFGLVTKAGLLKFNYANGKTETQNLKFSNSKIHISLVAFF